MKKKKKGRTGFFYLNPKRLSAEINTYGYTFSIQKAITYYIVYFLLILAFAAVFQLTEVSFMLVFVLGILGMPSIIRMSYKKLYEQQRFSDVTQYMEQMLYSFQSSRKVLKALQDTEVLFEDGSMREAIRNAQKEIMYGESKDSIRSGLKKIEEKYSCKKLEIMHDFMAKVEQLGGEFSASIELLLEDRSIWVERVLEMDKEKEHKRRNITISIFISLGLCKFIEFLIPESIPIAETIIYQISAVAMFFVDLLCYLLAMQQVSKNKLVTEAEPEEETIKRYTYVTTFDNKKEMIRSCKALFVPVLFLLCGIFFSNTVAMVIGLFFVPLIFLKPLVTYKTGKKKLIKEINAQFTSWLMEMGLLMQYTTVREAIRKSVPGAPAVLKPELNTLIEKLRENPTATYPYQEFFKELPLPDVRSSMKMLSAISNGSGSDAGEQIAKLIHQNIVLADKAEKILSEDSMAGLYAIFLIPQLSAGVKMLPDLMMFLLLFLNTTNI